MSITVYQLQDPTNERNNPESFLSRVYFALSFRGSKSWNEAYWRFFQPVAVVDTDNLEESFELMNLWNDESRVQRLLPLHSLSVGDIVKRNGKFFMVDSFGFSEVEVEA